MKQILVELREDYWSHGFKEGLRVGVMRDGHYHPPTDIDFLAMYCGGMFQ